MGDPQAIQRLDVFRAPLEGINLIEASAGTGKTYTITGLYLRLVVEAGIRVDQILVVTYTVAATEELRERIRSRLVAAKEALARGETKDDFCRSLLASCSDRQPALRRLTNAIRSFDEAAIFTIHGFCQRVLADSAFESGMLFETELLPDQREILQEIVDDFWRQEFYQTSPLFIAHLLDEGYSPDVLLQAVRPHVGKPYLQVLSPARAETGFEQAETEFSQAYRQARQIWQTDQAAVAALLIDNPNLNGNSYRKASIPGWLLRMEAYLHRETPNLALFDKFEKFTTGHLNEAAKKGKTPPRHDFFDACERLAVTHAGLINVYRQHISLLKSRLLDYCNAELEIRKRRRQVQSYDDLLINLHRALHETHGQTLAQTIRRRYSAALIDEFQDTDPVQYEIFRRVYGDQGLPVFLVGDPKQAIYSFRGADIFAYLKGRSDAAQRHTLDTNYRSDPGLIEAINALFRQNSYPFLFETIPFYPAEAAIKEREPLRVGKETQAPLRLWVLGGGADGKPLDKGPARELAARATAVEIARLLDLGIRGEAQVGERSLEGGDIAVLVRSHRQGRMVREELMRLGVPSVQQAQDNVFDAREALELERMLMAVAEPGRESLIKAALATELLGLTGAEIYQLGEDERAWEIHVEAFREYHRLWRERGFIRFFRTWLYREDVPRRLLRFRDGERRLTNLLHLAELLQTRAGDRGMEGLIKWLAEQRRVRGGEDDEQQLRLESDENLVKIVTVHKSKGLEYPVVFCPFLWDGKLWADDAKQDFVFHDPERERQPFLDLGSERRDAGRVHARREELAENLRLLYVALTRARHRCYMVWGKVKGAGTAAPAWLLHPPRPVDPDGDPLAAAAERFQALDDRGLWNELKGIEEQANGAVGIAPLPAREGILYRPPRGEELRFAARRFPGPLPGEWRVTSFSALATGHSAELPDYDAGPEVAVATEAEAPGPLLDAFDFPRGARAGSCLHAILERLDFTCRDRDELQTLLEKTLVEHGFETEWVTPVADMVEQVLATPLDSEGKVYLQAVTPERRLNELEFYYPLPRLEADGLRRLLIDHGFAIGPLRERIDSLFFTPTEGFMKGFIDLVFEADGRFYLVDYKSNWLGADPEDYREDRLPQAMADNAYYLQYLIYTVALHRFLKLRLPDYDYETHFGGIFYLFLRGMRPNWGPGYGVYRDRPERALIEALDTYMGGNFDHAGTTGGAAPGAVIQ